MIMNIDRITKNDCLRLIKQINKKYEKAYPGENKKLKLDNNFQIVKDLNGDMYWWADPDYYSDYESLLMKLSIQDNPVEYLISLLN